MINKDTGMSRKASLIDWQAGLFFQLEQWCGLNTGHGTWPQRDNYPAKNISNKTHGPAAIRGNKTEAKSLRSKQKPCVPH